MRIQIVCKGRVSTGLGHLFRAKTFASALMESVHAVEVVAVTDEGLRGILGSLNCPVVQLDNDIGIEAETRRFRPDVLVFDAVELDVAVVAAATTMVPVSVSISPIFNCADRMDVIFARAPIPSPSPNSQVLTGLKYSILGEHVRQIEDSAYFRNVDNDHLSVAVCMGGTDAPNKVFRVLKRLMDLEGKWCFWVLLGEGYEHSYDELVRLTKASTLHEIILAKTSRTMWDVMKQCAVGIFSGGLTLLESVYAGLPSINVFERPEHELAAAPEIFATGAAVNCGVIGDEALDAVIAHLERLYLDRSVLLSMRERCWGLVDANGAQRVLAVIEGSFRARAVKGQSSN